MKILTENTAFQNIEKTLEKDCSGENQPRDFLQFCIEFIIADNTFIVGTVPENIKQVSSGIINLLESKEYSLDKNFIDFEDIADDSENANKLVENVAVALLNDINNNDKYFEELKIYSSIINASDILPKLDEKTRELLKKSVIAANNELGYDKFVKENLKFSKFSRDSGYFRIINSKEEIIEKINNFGVNCHWTEELSYVFMSEVRTHTNRALADILKYEFMSSIDRGKRDYIKRFRYIDENKSIYRGKERGDFIEKLNNILREVGEIRYGPKEICMPSIKEYIIEKGKLEPKGVMKEAVILRNEFSSFREHINNMDGKQESLATLDDIKNETINKLGMTDQPKIIIERDKTIGIRKELYEINIPDSSFAKNNPLNICAQIFTEVTKNMYDNYISPNEKEFINKCMRK